MKAHRPENFLYMNELDIRAIAMFLPQFHPIPENDLWWGKGFTEWTNVTKCTPRFPGHYQPHLPADLGFYDLRLPETRESQARLAREYGIHGFCYYHYWFNGRRVLERPVTEIVKSGQPDFPFCLCWANENWTRRWDGNDQEVLLHQEYCRDDDFAHIRELLPTLHDPRYIRIDGKPLLLVYKLSALPMPEQTIEIWRTEASRSGLPGLFLCNVESTYLEHGLVEKYDLDAAIEFAPDWAQMPRPEGRSRRDKLIRVIRNFGKIDHVYSENRIGDYNILADNMLAKPAPVYPRIPCVTPSWDNSARRKTGAAILHSSTPEKYEQWLKNRVEFVQRTRSCKNLVFINAWNEWAEGNHLEPCLKWGHAYLEATKRALEG